MALENCSQKLNKDIDKCDPISNGILEGKFINKSDITEFVAVAEKSNTYSSITLKPSASATKVFDFRKIPFDGSEYSHEEGAMGDKTLKSYQFAIYDKGADADETVDQLKKSQLVLVVYNENQTFEIIGKEQGLRLTDHTRQPAGGDLDGAWLITMSCAERTTGNYLYDTDEETTLATYEAL